METQEISRFRGDAKGIVDLLFDNKLFKDEITRDDMNSVEGLIEFMMNSRYESHKKAEKINEKLQYNINKKP